VDALQPCVTYNKINTYDWYRARVYKVEEEPGYDPTDRAAAWTRAQEWGDRIPEGIIYQSTERPTYEEQVSVLKAGPLVQQELNGRYPDYEALKEALV
jgi:2-oxoglutarate ferredoxin oxidoreductase subunit beta